MSDEEKKIEDLDSNKEVKKVKETVEEIPAKELPHRDIRPGMVIRVHERIKDISPKGEERERIQVFEGVVMGMGSKGIARTMTVRKDSKGFMVEKIFPLASPNIVKVEIKKQLRVRRAKLSYLRGDFKRKLKEVKEQKIVESEKYKVKRPVRPNWSFCRPYATHRSYFFLISPFFLKAFFKY